MTTWEMRPCQYFPAWNILRWQRSVVQSPNGHKCWPPVTDKNVPPPPPPPTTRKVAESQARTPNFWGLGTSICSNEVSPPYLNSNRSLVANKDQQSHRISLGERHLNFHLPLLHLLLPTHPRDVALRPLVLKSSRNPPTGDIPVGPIKSHYTYIHIISYI